MKADVLSDVLRAVHLSGAVYFDFEASAPWVAEAPPSAEIGPIVMPGADRVIEYHVVARGACWAQALGWEAVRVQEGDVVVFPRGDAHVLSSSPGMRARPVLSMYQRGDASLPVFHQLGGGGREQAQIVCGFLGCDERPFNPLLAALPTMIHVSAAQAGATLGWLRTLLSLAVKESHEPRPGSDNVLARISELMFVAVVRQYLEGLPSEQRGWLAGLRDPVAGQALAALHGAPEQPWTVERLARGVGVSRSVLAERFTDMVGHAPMQYLALWRMQLASRLLIAGAGVAEVAAGVGYESEAAFSRAFKKLVGSAPATWRSTRLRGDGGSQTDGLVPQT